MTTGILIGCDDKLTWMLRWFLDNLKARTSLPVAFADLGLASIDEVPELKRVDTIIPKGLFHPPNLKGWYLKPFAIGASPFDRTIWMDLDIETRPHADFDKLLAICPEDKLCACPDPYMPNDWIEIPQVRTDCGKPWDGNLNVIVNTGFIVVGKGNPLLAKWRLETSQRQLLGMKRPLRGDEEILGSMSRLCDGGLFPIPAEYCALALGCKKQFKAAMFAHHTGADGKARIVKMIEGRHD